MSLLKLVITRSWQAVYANNTQLAAGIWQQAFAGIIIESVVFLNNAINSCLHVSLIQFFRFYYWSTWEKIKVGPKIATVGHECGIHIASK